MRVKLSSKRVDRQASLICVILVICSSLSIFLINYITTYENVIATLRERTDAIYNTMDELLYAELFEVINDEEDMESEVYKTYQQRMERMKNVSNVRYLYTAKKNDQGQYVYHIDGLALHSEDYAKPGDLIEEDVLEDIDLAYNGEIVFPDDIIDTSWGKIFLAYYPIHGGVGHTDDVVGVVGIEIDAESQFNTYNDLIRTTPIIIAISCVLAFIISKWCFRYISNPRRKDLYNIDALTGLKNRMSLTYDLHNLSAMKSEISIIMIDLDKLKVINDKYGHGYGDEYIKLTAEAIEKGVGKIGTNYRIGGDEFVTILNTIDSLVIEKILENINTEFYKLMKDFKGESSLSVGYAIFDDKLDKDLNDTIDRADHQMYIQKKEKYKEDA